jgi:hypothetical protein
MSNAIKLKSPGKCIFCGQAGSLTKQHIFPDRLKGLIARDADHHFSAPIIIVPGDNDSIFVHPQTPKKRNGSIGTRRPRIVCKSCNGGWMRIAEEAAFDVITPLILGDTSVLSQEALEKVALFSGIIFSMADTDHPPTSAVSFEERNFVFRNRRLPQNWFVFMARTNSDYWRIRFYHIGAKAGPVGSSFGRARCNFHVCTIGMGALLLHAVSGPNDAWISDPKRYAELHKIARVSPNADSCDMADIPILDESEILELANWLPMKNLERSLEALKRV